MSGDAKDAEKQRRRAEALRANLKRRKAARGGRTQTACESERAVAPTPDGNTQGD